MTEEIRELDPATVDRIAAGEVVERPASVVKELVENSLDADASRIEVEVEGDGTERIVVRDDGVGMTRPDAKIAVRQHTTSKIRDADDLGSVATLGFRGEALHTIAAVSRTTVTTRARTGDGPATELRVEGGDVVSVEPAGRAPGTTITVEDLFYNTPARREFLSAPSTEFGHVNRAVSRYALANPDVAVSLSHDGSETFATPGDGDLRGAVLAVYGRKVAESMIRVDAAPDGSLEGVSGYVSHPETTRSTREYLATYVNGRYVSDSVLREALVEAYGTQLAADRFPFAVLDVEIAPSAVDANVHPRKMEVRFEDEAGVREGVTEAVRDALLEHGLVRSRAPRGASQPRDAAIAPERPDDGVERSDSEDDTGDGASEDGRRESASAESPQTRGRSRPGATSRRRTPETGTTDTSSSGSTTSDSRASHTASSTSTSNTGSDARKFAGASRNARLPGTKNDAAEETAERERLPEMRVLGQLHDTYVVAETASGLVLVDQHAADERVRYEALREELGESPDSQALVAPAKLEVTAAEAASFEASLDALRDAGFEAELDGRTVVVSAVPAVFGQVLDAELVRDVLASAASAVGGDDVQSAADAVLADMACKPAIKGNTSLPEGDVTALLDALDACEEPWACPHGRPVVVELDEAELDARFERDYPGHQDRAPE
ncbi:DNA mismatch repair endonuclease MutL [Halarchaeum sp. P4]|uniref:DNA mismatch repair endonuclease MutL n=1 Tax=Halarchaeum sp. P4 TaxID=3421639 RepID=UPI003EBA743B